MVKKIISIYKVQLLLSITLSIVLLAIGVVRNPFEIVSTILGCIIGTFVLDSEYLLFAYMFDPESSYSKDIRGYVEYKDYKGLIDYIQSHKNSLKDKSLNSAIFQVILVPISILAVYTATSYFIKAFVLSVLASSIYKIIETYFEGDLEEWFWAIKSKPNKDGFVAYTLALVVVLIFCISIF